MGDLVYLTFLFGLWLAVIAVVVYASARRESSGKSVRTWVVGVGVVAGYLLVALPALLVDSYSIIVAAFAVACAIQGVHFGVSMVRARRLADRVGV
jgi:hypothetical protein